MAGEGVIVLAHGSRGERGMAEVGEVLQRITAGLKPFLEPGTEISGASLQFNRPNLGETVASLAAKGVRRIVIAPYFLFNGRHITEDIPQLIQGLRHDYPGIRFVQAPNLGLEQSFIGLMARRIRETMPESSIPPDTRISPIEVESMGLVEELLPSPVAWSPGEKAVVKRLVHASGDPGVASLVRFSPSAVSRGLEAIAAGCPIYTDVRMVQAGVSETLAGLYSCSLCCALDELPVAVAETNVTRAASAITHLGERLNGAIVAIGNAPTALFALLGLADEGIRPALVVGMPVGFVKAAESKEELMKREVPYITVTGTRGGSPLAAAAVNALLRMAAESGQPSALSSQRSVSVP